MTFLSFLEPYVVHIGNKIAQVILHKIERRIFVENNDLTWTERRTKGFGCSGI